MLSETTRRRKRLSTDHIEILHKIAGELLEKEVLNGAEIDAMIGNVLPECAIGVFKKNILNILCDCLK